MQLWWHWLCCGERRESHITHPQLFENTVTPVTDLSSPRREISAVKWEDEVVCFKAYFKSLFEAKLDAFDKKKNLQIYKVNICLAPLNCTDTFVWWWQMHPGCSALGLVDRKVGHRGSRLLHSEFTLLSHITIPLTSLPLASGCGLHHIHCQVKHSGLLFNTPHHALLSSQVALMCPSWAGRRIGAQFASTPIYRHLYLRYEKLVHFHLCES